MSRKYFKEGDRTNFSFYESIESYQIQNPNSTSIMYAFVEANIKKYGYIVNIESVTDLCGNDLSHLAFGMPRPGYVIGPSFKLRKDSQDIERGLAVAKFIRDGEAAHEATKNSKLVFKAN